MQLNFHNDTHGDLPQNVGDSYPHELFGAYDIPNLFHDQSAGLLEPDAGISVDAGFFRSIFAWTWTIEIAFSSTKHRAIDSHLILHWETGVVAEIFGDSEPGVRLKLWPGRDGAT